MLAVLVQICDYFNGLHDGSIQCSVCYTQFPCGQALLKVMCVHYRADINVVLVSAISCTLF